MVLRSRPRYGYLVLCAVAVMVSIISGCTPEPAADAADAVDGKLAVTVSVVPQQYFVERIGGEHVSAMVMVGPGDNPATYEPKPEQLKALSRSAAYFSIGVAFEGVWLDRIADANPDMRVVDTIEGIDRHAMDSDHHHDGEELTDSSAEATGAPDPHVWVSPELVKVQVRTIYEALVELDPSNAAAYQENLEGFLEDIDVLIADMREALAGVSDSKFMVFHPSWGYFAADFGLEQIAIEVGGQEPSAQEMAGLIDVARAEHIRVIFAQPEFSTVDAETIAQEIGGEVLLISPLAYDWLENLRMVASTFAEVLAE